MKFTLNGNPVSVEIGSDQHLLEVLREHCGVTSVKDGCAPEGSCGACTVLIDGNAVVSCAQPAHRFEGRQIVTHDGLDDSVRARWAECFVASGASQCGFCSPGIVMKAESLLGRIPDPSRERIAAALAGNLCRCTGYQNIVASVVRAAEISRERAASSPARAGAPAAAPPTSET